MSSKEKNSIELFLMDLNFRDWAISPKPETERYWKTWLKNNPNKKAEFLFAKELIQKIEFKQYQVSDECYEEIFEKSLLGQKSKYAYNNPRLFKKTDFRYFWRVAAIFVAAAFISGLYFSGNIGDADKRIAKIGTIVKNNDAGRKSQIYLPDGTIVWLNSKSSIEYDQHFSGDERLVKLAGEAYFDVAKDHSKKFIVQTSSIAITTIGTQFNVNAFNNYDRHQIALAEGKVMVQQIAKRNENNQKVYLDPGQSLSVIKSSGQMIQGSFDPRKVLSWRDGIIYFEDATFNDVVEVLQRWYGKRFIIKNSEKSGVWQFSSEFNNETLENVMQTISYSKNFEYTIEGETVNIIF